MISERILEKTALNRVRLTDTLIAFVKTDTILFAFDSECMGYYKQFVMAANNVLNTVFMTTVGLEIAEVNLRQDSAVRSYFDALPVRKFTLLYLAAIKTRSVLLGVLFAEKMIDCTQLFEAAYYEELWQQKKWGMTTEAEERHNAVIKELQELERARDEIGISED